MNQSIDNRPGDVVIDEELAPVSEFLVSGQNDRAVFIQRVDQLEQIVRPLFVQRQIAHLVNNQHIELGELVDFLYLAATLSMVDMVHPLTSQLAIQGMITRQF